MGCGPSSQASGGDKPGGFQDVNSTFQKVGKEVSAKGAAHHVRNVFATPFEMLDFEAFKISEHSKTKEETELINTALKKNFVFEQMSQKELRPLVHAFEKHSVKAGEVIIKQGDEGNYFYIILAGTCSFEVDGKEVGRAKDGNSFGELALLCK